MATTLISSSASKTLLLLQNPNPHHNHNLFLHPTTLSIRLPPKPSSHLQTLIHSSSPKPFKISASNLPSQSTTPLIKSQITNSTHTITSLLALTLTSFRSLALRIKALTFTPTPSEFAALQTLNDNLVCTVGPLFFAAIRSRPSGALNTPLTVVAAGLSKWLDIYSGVLLVRVLLSWFPNIPWDRQPLSAIRDLCDPYLNLFRNIIPPIFDTLDVSPLLAFAVLGALATLLKNSTGL